jgi:hypothetical protein
MRQALADLCGRDTIIRDSIKHLPKQRDLGKVSAR